MDTVSQKIDLRNVCEDRARMMVHLVQTYWGGRKNVGQDIYSNNDFYAFGDAFDSKWVRHPHLIKAPEGWDGWLFECNDYANILIGNFRPMQNGESEVKLLPPETLQSQVVQADETEFINDTDEVQDKSHDFLKIVESVETLAQKFATKASAHLRQLFTYGGEIWGGGGETELTATLETEFASDSAYARTDRREQKVSWNGKVPIQTIQKVLYKEERVRIRQDLMIKGDIDFDIIAYSEDDFRCHWQGVNEILECFNGVSRKKEGRDTWAEELAYHPLIDYVPDGLRYLSEGVVQPLVHEVVVSEEIDKIGKTSFAIHATKL